MCMASGTVVSGEGSGGGGGSGGGRGERERQRWAEGSKVYTRKSFKGARNQTNGNSGSVFANINFVGRNDSNRNGNTNNTNNNEDPNNQNRVRDIPREVSGTPNDVNGISKDIAGTTREIGEIQGETSEIRGECREIPKVSSETPDEISEIPGRMNESSEGSGPDEIREEANEIPKEANEIPKEADEIPKEPDEIPKEANEIPKEADEIPKEADEIPKEADEIPKEADEIQKEADDVWKESSQTPNDNVEIRRDNGETEAHLEIHKVAAEQLPETLVLEESIVPQQILRPVEVLSDDSSSLNRSQHVLQLSSPRDLVTVTNGVVNQGAYRLEDKMKLNLSSRSKQEMRQLRRKLEDELNTVRSLEKRMKVKEGQAIGSEFGNFVLNDNEDYGGARRVKSEVASVSVAPREPIIRPLHQLSISVIENNHGMSEFMEKEKRTPKANQFYRNSEFLLAKDKFPPAESNKKSKTKSNGKKSSSSDYGFGTGSRVFKSCNSLLDRLTKHKHGWVFNSPVNPVALGLHDYFTIITHPMDLGTVKARLSKNWYKSPREFAEDVRLTFHNAMTYNPKGQDVHVMAEILLKIFEDKWIAIEAEYLRELKLVVDYDAGLPTPTSRRTPFPSSLYPTLDMRRILDRSESMTNPVDPRTKTLTYIPSIRTPVPKKPKAKDPNKRDMTYEEKQKLSTNLQSLPAEKLDGIVQIIKKRNSVLSQHDDEIEVDIDSVDNETLWELDRYVTNYKKSLSKNKRKAELATQARSEAKQSVHEKIMAPAAVEASREAPSDHKTAPSSSPVKGSNQPETASKSSSSSSSSSDSGSSSSDSDSDSSSDESDAGRSPAA